MNAMMNPTPAVNNDDLSALAWVHEELRRSLEAAHKVALMSAIAFGIPVQFDKAHR